jgi:hypothetical protein
MRPVWLAALTSSYAALLLPCSCCSGDVPVEYCGEEQAICCVGLAKPRPGVFLSAIQHVLVLATTVEVCLHGMQELAWRGSSVQLQQQG